MSVHSIDESPLYGLMAEFETASELVDAARRTKEAGFRKFDAYSPFPLHELDDAMDLHDNRVSLFTLIGGLIGCCTGFGLASWVEAVALPLNIGGTAADQRADVYPDHVRIDDSVWRADCRDQHDHHERLALAVSSGFQRGAIRRDGVAEASFFCASNRTIRNSTGLRRPGSWRVWGRKR